MLKSYLSKIEQLENSLKYWEEYYLVSSNEYDGKNTVDIEIAQENITKKSQEIAEYYQEQEENERFWKEFWS